MIFVDTGAWFASVVPSDRDHPAATRWLSQNTQALITTDYIADDGKPRVQAHPNTEPHPALLRQTGIARVQGVEHPQAHQDSALRVIFMRGRKAEIHQ